jgi:hypothetical protein
MTSPAAMSWFLNSMHWLMLTRAIVILVEVTGPVGIETDSSNVLRRDWEHRPEFLED